MFRLKAFGSLTLERKDGEVPVAATQRRRLALLAAIASAGPSGIARDKAAALLWPESDTESARHSLSQLLYSIRRALGADPFANSSGNLRLICHVMSSDIADFDSALTAGDLEKAVTFYTGPFLDGFNPPDSAEYEQWMESERARRTKQTSTALESLAVRAAATGDWDLSARWWRKAAALDLLDSRIAASLMKALDSAGNRPGALQHAKVHSSLVREHLGIEPDAVVSSYENQLRSAAPPVHASQRHAPVAVSPPAADKLNGAGKGTPDAEFVSIPINTEPARDLPAKTTAPSIRALWNWRRGAAGAGLGVLAAASFLFYSDTTASRVSVMPSSVSVVAILPFAVHGDSSIAYLRDGLVDLLSSDLDGAGDLRAVDPRALLSLSGRSTDGPTNPEVGRSIANRFGADLFVLGDVANVGGRIRLSAQLHSRSGSDAPLASAVVEGERSNLFALVDQVAVKLLAARFRGPSERLMRTAGVTTHSLAALKYYLRGETELRLSRHAPAMQAFEEAVRLDTTFALAYYRMSIAAEWLGLRTEESIAADKAVKFSDRLSEHDRKLVEALSARRHSNPDRAELLYRQIVRQFPDDVDAWYQLGEVLFHDNSNRGRSFLESREAWEHVLALVPNEGDALLHMIRIVARTGTRSAQDSMFSAALPFLSPDQQLETGAFRAFTIGTAGERDSFERRLASADPEIAFQVLWRLAVYSRNIEGAKRVARLLTAPRQSLVTRSKGHEALMLLLLSQGQRSAALHEGAQVVRLYPWSVKVGQIYFQSLGFAGNDFAETRLLKARFDNWVPSAVGEESLFANPQGVLGPHFKAYSAGLLSNILRETSLANTYAARVAALPAPPFAQNMPELFALVLRVGALRRSGHPAEALSLLENWSGVVPLELGASMGVDPYRGWLRAELLNENARESEALRWYESRADLFISEVIYIAPAALKAGQIYERLGNRQEAIESYRLFVNLWSGADQGFQPLVTKARERLARLTNGVSIN